MESFWTLQLLMVWGKTFSPNGQSNVPTLFYELISFYFQVHMFSYIHHVGKDSTPVDLVSDIAFFSSFKLISFGLREPVVNLVNLRITHWILQSKWSYYIIHLHQVMLSRKNT